jgi:ABC-type transport system involved in cytochrome c biogenesis ATPase subunit
MKIHSIHLFRAGPIEERNINLTNTWSGGVHDRLLFSGPNGTGKSTVLRAIANLWLMAGQWLATPEIKPKGQSEPRAWLRDHAEAVGLVVKDIPGMNGKIGLFYGRSEQFKSIEPQAEFWMGELDDSGKGPGKTVLIHRDNREWMRPWSSAYSILCLLLEPSIDLGLPTPNVIYLDGEDRRWVRPKGTPSQPIPDDPKQRWLVSYKPTDKWQGQLEASLIALKIVDEARFYEVLEDINRFLVGKSIRKQPTPTLRLLVDIKTANGARNHLLDDLSAGERQVLIQLYLVSRWLQPGGLVLLDEPDLHLHPSLLPMFLGRMEAIVAERGGQLFITSHLPELWRSYETKALRVELGGDL